MAMEMEMELDMEMGLVMVIRSGLIVSYEFTERNARYMAAIC